MAKISAIFTERTLPGASIIIQSEGAQEFAVGERGTVVLPLITNWASQETMTLMTRSDIITGVFYEKFGDTPKQTVELALFGANKVLIYPLNKGTKATKVLGSLTVTAKYKGTFGNKISVGVKEKKVTTVVDGIIQDEQSVNNYNELVENDYVTFTGTGTPSNQAFTLLESGTNGTISDYNDFFDTLLTQRWDVLACTDKKLNTNAKALITTMREDYGKKVQAVMVDDTADYEGIIKLTEQELKMNDIKFTPEELTAYVAGITAGATVQDSNTNKLTPFTEIIDELLPTEQEKAIKKGYFIFTYRQSGAVRCEQDINSLTTFTSKKANYWRKNKIIRVLDEINNTIKRTFEDYYQGEMDNNDRGRTVFKGALVDYFTKLQNVNAITDFNSDEILVKEGKQKDEVFVQVAIKPVDKVEKLYMLVRVR